MKLIFSSVMNSRLTIPNSLCRRPRLATFAGQNQTIAAAQMVIEESEWAIDHDGF